MDIIIFFWLITALLFFLIELGHPGLFFFLSFALGALSTAGIAALGYSFWTQCMLFFATTIVAIILLKTWVRAHAKASSIPTNIDALKGKRGVVIKAITSLGSGQVKLNGQVWSAKAVDGQSVELQAQVEVVDISGCHLIVQELVASEPRKS